MCSMSLSLPWPPRGQAPGRGSMRARPWRGAPPVTAAPETPWELRRRSAEALKGFAPSLQNWAWPSENMLKSSLKAQLKSSSKPERHSKTLCLPQLSRTAFHESIGLKHLPQSSLSAPWPNEAVEPREPFSSSSELVRLRPQASSQPAQATKGYKRIQKDTKGEVSVPCNTPPPWSLASPRPPLPSRRSLQRSKRHSTPTSSHRRSLSSTEHRSTPRPCCPTDSRSGQTS